MYVRQHIFLSARGSFEASTFGCVCLFVFFVFCVFDVVFVCCLCCLCCCCFCFACSSFTCGLFCFVFLLLFVVSFVCWRVSFCIFFFVFDVGSFLLQLGLHFPPLGAPKTIPKSIQKISKNHVAARWPPRSLQDGPRLPTGRPKTPQHGTLR